MILQTLLQDLRFGMRRLAKKPSFLVVVVFILALGIGANTAIFSVVSAVLLSPLPYEESGQLVVIKETNPARTTEPNSVSPGNFLDLNKQNPVFDSVTAWYETASTLQSDQDAEQVASVKVSVDFFKVLRVKPALGRVFLPGEISGAAFDTGQFISGDRVVVISDSLWRRRFGADPAVSGKKITVNRQDWEVVGVMPADFAMPSKETDLWIPWDIAQTYGTTRFPEGPPRDWRFLNALGRLNSNVTHAQAQSNLASFYAGLAERYPKTNRGWSATSSPLYEEVVGSSRLTLLVLFGALAMVLLLACANVAGLQLAHATSRQREFALRLALGASRFRLIRQLLTESILLALSGGLIGVGLAWLSLDLILALAPANTPRLSEVAIDARVLLFTLFVSVAAGIVFGLIPALRTTASELSGSLKDAGTKGVTKGLTNYRFRNAMVISEISVALVLITCAGLFARSFTQILSVNPGFDTNNLLTMHIVLDGTVYDRRAADYYRQLIERIETLPAVTSAAAITTLPMSDVGVDFTRPYWREGDPEPSGDGDKVAIRMATPGYFKTMRIPVTRGRNFSDDDRRDTPAVLIVSASMAEKVWPNENPVGKRLMLDYNRGKYAYEVIGVTEGVRYYGLKKDPRPEVFIPHAQNAYLPMNLVVRTSVEPRRLVESVKAEVRALDATQPVSNFTTMEELVNRSVATDRFSMWLLGLLASLALALATSGVFSLMSYFVSQRTHELGVRIALGAQPRDIFKLILGEGALLIVAGLALGVAGAFVSTRFLSSLLFGVDATDPLTFLTTPMLLALAALVACYIPARRATKVDPLVALRSE
ncbi:MAG: ABC transporter permease [Pyrinomonadaceae bacterium]|nr:ABC transporter permease [Pyrinomonadaceae bacterium]